MVTLAAVVAGTPGSAQEMAPPLSDLRLVRCDGAMDASFTGCLSAIVDLPAPFAKKERLEPDGSWEGMLGTDALRLGSATAHAAIQPEVAVLVLFDVSGSMARDSALQRTRVPLKQFILRFSETEARVAVAPFGSLNVGPRILHAAFLPPVVAAGELDALPEPREDTALYSALHFGAQAVGLALQEMDPGARGAIVLVTDGRNDIENKAPGRVDPDLLTGSGGRDYVIAELDRVGVRVNILGIGQAVDSAELSRLAGPAGLHELVGIEALAIDEALDGISAAVLGKREVVFRLPPGTDPRLMLSEVPVSIRFHGGDGSDFEATGRLRPPRLAAPAFWPSTSGTRSGLREPPGRSLALAAFLALAWIGLVLAAPTTLAQPPLPTASYATVEEAAPPTGVDAPHTQPPEPAGSAEEPTEAPPRRLDEQTRQRATLRDAGG